MVMGGPEEYDVEDDEELGESVHRNHGEELMGTDEGEDLDEEVDEEDDDENCIEIDEHTLIAIIKVQALIRGFLTRKMIFEHLQRMVQENQMMYQDGDVIDGDEDEYDGEEVYGEEGEDVPDGVEGESEYDAEEDEVIDPHGYQDPVQEVCTEDEQTSDEGDGQPGQQK